jgi:hypothetical protein
LNNLNEQYGDRNFGYALVAAGTDPWMPAKRYFNGEPSWKTRLRKDRLCQPLITFHHVDDEEKIHIQSCINTAGQMNEIITWYDPWRWDGPSHNSSHQSHK